MPALVLLALLLCGTITVRSQEYVYRAFRQPQGLENLSLNALATGPQGFLWVATENGLYRFLGSSFHRYGSAEGIVEQNVKAVFFAPDGTLWAGTDENLYRWNGKSFQPASANATPISHANDIATGAPGELLVLSKGTLHRLRYQQDVPVAGGSDQSGKAIAPANDDPFFTSSYRASHPALEHIGGFTALPDGTLWLACAKMICSWHPLKDTSGQPVLTEWGEASGVTPDVYSTILRHPNGSIWAAGGHHILELPHTGPNQAAPHTFLDRSVPASAHNGTYDWVPLATDTMGRIVTSVGTGIDIWDGTSWRNVSKNNGLASTHMTTFLFDAAGDMWTGTNGHGLYQWLGYRDWEGWAERQGLPSSNVWSVGLFDQNRAVVGTEQGPATVDPATGKVSARFPADTWKYGQITGIVSQGNGDILAGTSSGAMLRIQQHPAHITQIADLQTYVYQMVQEPNGRSFILTKSGVFDAANLNDPRLAPVPQFASLMGTTPGQPAPSFSNACVAIGSTWFINKHGLIQHTFTNNQDLWTRPQIDGLPNGATRIRDVTCDPNGSLWVTVNDSMFWHLVPEKSENSPITRLQAVQLTLPEDSRSLALIGAVVDRRGWLWIGTDSGLLAFNGSTWRHLTQENGLIWNDCNENRLAFGPDGSLWIATSGGLGRIRHPEHIFADQPSRIAMVEVKHGTQVLPLADTLDMPWSRLDLSFQFAAPAVLNRSGLVFDYRNEGIQDDWVETRNEIAHFQSLPAGSYTFQVYARDLTSGIRSQTLTVHFKIEAPWWRTRWFYALCAMASLLCVVLLLHLRTKRLLAQHRHLEKLVHDRTSELEASREELRRQATHDALTGLLNRSAMLSAFRLEMGRSIREGSPLTLVLGDIDHFKRVNDTYGHLAGDEALRHFASILAGSVRSYDHVGRYGGEEFLILLINIGPAEVNERLEALHASITNLTVIDGAYEFTLTCSLGAVCMEPGDLTSGNPIADQKLALSVADEALYQAKRTGRNRVVLGQLGEFSVASFAEVPQETV